MAREETNKAGEADHLFAALTRPALVFYLPGYTMGFYLVIPALLGMTVKFYFFFLIPVIYAALFITCAKDPRKLEYYVMWLKTAWRGGHRNFMGSNNRAFWKGSSYAPYPLKRRD